MSKTRQRSTATGRRDRCRRWAAALVVVGSVVWALPAVVMAASEQGGDTRPGSARTCRVCELAIERNGVAILHEGRRVWTHPDACLAHWREDPAAHFRALQARGALFDEETTRGSSGYGWLAFGIYMLVGTVCGAIAAYAAVTRARSPRAWFLLGLAFNVVAVVAIVVRSREDPSGLPAGIPRGLRKVPTTRDPASCHVCGRDNHPTAARCSSCDAALEPVAAPETARI